MATEDQKLTTEIVEAYFKQLDWPFTRQDDHTWSTGYKGDNVQFNFIVRFTDSWFYVLASFPVKIQEAAAPAFHKHILHLNYSMSMAKFSLDSDEDALLSVEMPNDSLQLSEFKDALEGLCYYMDQNYADLVQLASGGAATPAKPA